MKKILKQLIKVGSNLLHYAFAIVTIIETKFFFFFFKFSYTLKYEDMNLFHYISYYWTVLQYAYNIISCNNACY